MNPHEASPADASTDAARALERWALEQACRDLVVRAAACIDGQDYEAFGALFAPDGELVRPGAELLKGPQAIVAAYRSRPAGRLTRHLISNTLVDLQSPGRAAARSLVLLWSGVSSDLPTDHGRPAQARQVVGEFDDRFVMTADGWRFTRRDARFVLFKE